MESIKVLGLDDLLAALNKAATMDDIKEVVQLNGTELHRRMMRNARFRGHWQGNKFVKPTGNLKRSITFTSTVDGLEVRVKPTAGYAAYVEWGTRFMSSQSFVRPSFYEQEKKFKNDLKRLMR